MALVSCKSTPEQPSRSCRCSRAASSSNGNNQAGRQDNNQDGSRSPLDNTLARSGRSCIRYCRRRYSSKVVVVALVARRFSIPSIALHARVLASTLPSRWRRVPDLFACSFQQLQGNGRRLFHAWDFSFFFLVCFPPSSIILLYSFDPFDNSQSGFSS